MADEAYTLSVQDEADGGGIEIFSTTTLQEVRRNFPIPIEFAFGVPPSMEAKLFASSFMPLVLLNSSDTHVATLCKRPSELSALNEQIFQLEHELKRARADANAHSSKYEAAAAALKTVEQARDTAVANVARLRRQASLQQDGCLRCSKHRLDELLEEPARLRAELAEVRAAAVAFRTQLASALDSLPAQIRSAQLRDQEAQAKQHSAHLELLAQQHRKRLAHLTDELGTTAEDLGAMTVAQRSMEESLRRRDKRIAELEVALAEAQPPPQLPSSFADYAAAMRQSNLKRDLGTVFQLGHALAQQPSSTGAQDRLLTMLAKLSHTVNQNGLDGAPAAAPQATSMPPHLAVAEPPSGPRLHSSTERAMTPIVMSGAPLLERDTTTPMGIRRSVQGGSMPTKGGAFARNVAGMRSSSSSRLPLPQVGSLGTAGGGTAPPSRAGRLLSR